MSKVTGGTWMPLLATESEPVLLIKLGGLGDVVRTAGLLPGLKQRWNRPLTWLTSSSASELIQDHPLVDETLSFHDPDDAAASNLAERPWAHIVSLEECVATCRSLSLTPARQPHLSGVFYDGRDLRYTSNLSSWFDMSMISRFGRTQADAFKRTNTLTYLSHIAHGLSIIPQRPSIHVLLDQSRMQTGILRRMLPTKKNPNDAIIGVSTGAGPAWPAKALAESSTLELIRVLNAALGGQAIFVLVGGERESQRNASLCATMKSDSPLVRVVDATTSSIGLCANVLRAMDMLLTSDSFAMHLGLAMEIPTVAFFTVTSPFEIDMWNTGIAVELTSPYNRSYRRDLGPMCIDIEPLVRPALRQLRRGGCAI